MKKKYGKSDKVNKIKDLLSLNEPPASKKEALEKNKNAVLSSLLSLGATHAIVLYNGSGDSGQVEEIRVYSGKNELTLKSSDKVRFYEGSTSFDPSVDKKDPWKTSFKKIELSLEAALSQIAEDLLDYNGIDWYNNDGGYGEVEINLKKNKLKLKHNQRIMSENYEEHEV
jgi:hypothetical protein